MFVCVFEVDDYWEAHVAPLGHLGHKNLPRIRVPHPVSPFPGWSKKSVLVKTLFRIK